MLLQILMKNYCYRVTQLEEEQQGMAVALTDGQRKLEEEKNKAQHLAGQVS